MSWLVMSAQGTREGQGHAGSSAAEDCGGASLNSLHLDAVQHPPQGPRQSVVVLLLGLVTMKAVVMVVSLCWRCHGLLGFGFVQSRKEGQEPPHPFHTSIMPPLTQDPPLHAARYRRLAIYPTPRSHALHTFRGGSAAARVVCETQRP